MHPTVQTFFDTATSTATHLVSDPDTRAAAIIDPGLDYEPKGAVVSTTSADRVLQAIADKGLELTYVLETHAHADHLSGSQWLKKRYDAKVVIGRGITQVQAVFKQTFALDGFADDGRQFDQLLNDRELFRAGSLVFKVLPTPGHTPACVSYLVGDAVFTGDALFQDDLGVGRCDFPKGDAATLYESVTTQLFTLPDSTRLFVGHDYPPAGRGWKASTTVAEAKRANIHLNASVSKEQFVNNRTARDRTLSVPRLLYPSVQVNIDAGRLPEPGTTGKRFLKLPLTGL